MHLTLSVEIPEIEEISWSSNWFSTTSISTSEKEYLDVFVVLMVSFMTVCNWAYSADEEKNTSKQHKVF